ncbi:T9SS type A sorting domain-containing protein [Hymenobacter sp.]|uniref:beta strand repeat-containing protein n=1 Tax=Hymenobacter sp. TaxID=1898978 RepID=UPI00286BA310|nr:T9SS type A sorting domain-containing protein [Hymenobacter sp.]
MRRIARKSPFWKPALAAALGLLGLGPAFGQQAMRLKPTAVVARARPALPAPMAPARLEVASPPVRHRGILAAIVSTATGGNWSDPTTWVGGVVPTAADDVTVAAGATVTLDVAAAAGSLTVAATGALLTSATTAYQLQVAGSVTNNGTLDLSSSATIGSDLRFTGAGSVTFGGTGTTDLQTVTLAKAVRADVVDLDLPTLSVKGSATAGDGFLLTRTTAATPADDMTGTLKISGTASRSSQVVGGTAGSYVIPATGGLWLNNPNFTVAGRNGSPVVSGSLRVSAGTFNVGTSIGNSLTFGSGAAYTQEGGTVNVAGRFSNGGLPITFTLSGGTLNNMVIGSTSSNSSFGLFAATGVAVSAVVVDISGGTINLVNRNGAATPGLDYNVTGTPNITGGTLQVGTAATATNFNFRLNGYTPSVVVDNTGTAKTATQAGTVVNFGTLLVTTGATFNLGATTLVQLGASITNNGTFTASTVATPTTDGSRLYFQGNAAQTIGGTGTFTSPISQVSFDNSGPGVSINVPLVTRNVAMFQGNVLNANNLTVFGSGNSLALISYGTTAPTASAGTFDVSPTFNITAPSGLYLIYNPETTARTTGLEIPATRSALYLDINNPQGVTLAGGNLTVTGGFDSFTLTSGVLTTSAASKVIVAKAAAIYPTGSATSYVNGPLGITVNSAPAVARTFAVGDAAGWRPVVVAGIVASTDQTFTATVVSGATGGAGEAPVTNLNPTRYVRLENSASLPATATVQLSAGADDVVGNAATAVVAQADAADGAYASIGGAAATGPAPGTVSTLALTPGSDFFVLANTEGGALTSSVAAVCTGPNSGTLTLTNSVGTVEKYQADSGSGFVDVAGANTTATLAFTNLTVTTTFRAVITTADGRTVFSAPVTVIVYPLPAASLTASTPTTFCGSGTLTLEAVPVAGAMYQYQLNGADIAGATSATYTATVSAGGVYTVVVTSAVGCSATSAPVAVTVNPATTATFAYAGATFCASGPNPTPTVTGTAGGTFSSTTGLSLDAATGVINLAASTLGTYVVTYSVGGTCPSTATASVTVTSAPLAAFSYASAAYCVGGAPNPTPAFAPGASAGVFSSTAGLIINATTGALTLASSTPGTYTVTNTIAASGGCAAATATTSVTINAAPTAAIATTTPTTFCQGGSVVLTAPAGAGNTYQFQLNGANIAGATSATYTATAGGAYTVIVTNAGSCSATSAATAVVVNALPATPTISVAYNGATTTLTSSATTGNQFFLNGVAIAGATGQTYVVNGTPAQLGAYTVVTTNANGCASAPSLPLTVTSSRKPLAGSSLSVFPNPTRDGQLRVQLTGYRKATELTVFNALGQVVFTVAVPASAGTTTQAVNLASLPSGIYVLRAKTEGGLDTRRIVKE